LMMVKMSGSFIVAAPRRRWQCNGNSGCGKDVYQIESVASK
jgi:hypothetical protein